MPAIEGILESSLYVQDVARAVAFYRDVLGLRLMSEFEDGQGAAFAAGRSVLLLFRADATRRQTDPPPHGATGSVHLAFRVKPTEMAAWKEHLTRKGVPIETEHAFGENLPSVYFRDPDGNSLELAVETIWPL